MGLMIPAMHVDIDQIDPDVSDFVISCLLYTTRLQKDEPHKFAGAHYKRRCGSLMPFTHNLLAVPSTCTILHFFSFVPHHLEVPLEHRGKASATAASVACCLLFSSGVTPNGKRLSLLTCRVGGASSIRPVRLHDPIHDATGDQPR